jgi:glutamate racemase
MQQDAPREPVVAARAAACRIGVFDSGVGGLSVLRALHARLRGVDLHYLADSANAPYGEREGAQVLQRSMRIAEHLLGQGAQLLVVACNTATAVAAAALRERWPGVPIVGVEPGLKPALALTRNGRIGVMATAMTLRSDKFQRLMASVTPHRSVHLRACDGLAVAIERGDLDDPVLLALVEAHCAPLRDAGVDCVVLGCTHYPFVAHHIQAALGAQVQLVDTAWAVAQQAERLLGAICSPASEPAAVADALLETTADAATLTSLANAWLPFTCRVQAAPAGL